MYTDPRRVMYQKNGHLSRGVCVCIQCVCVCVYIYISTTSHESPKWMDGVCVCVCVCVCVYTVCIFGHSVGVSAREDGRYRLRVGTSTGTTNKQIIVVSSVWRLRSTRASSRVCRIYLRFPPPPRPPFARPFPPPRWAWRLAAFFWPRASAS